MSLPGLSLVRRSLVAAVAVVGLAAPTAASAAAVTPVPKLELNRYLGQWYEIASIPQWFEAFCARDTKANYALNGDGTVAVTNTCTSQISTTVTARGRARLLDKVTGAQLQVTFANLFGQWFYTGSGPNYIVMGLDPDYRWAVVGDPARSSGFVLSRTPALTSTQKADILAVLTANGYDPSALKTTRQAGGIGVKQAFNS